MSLGKYRKRPVVIDAVQWTGYNDTEVFRFFEQGNRSVVFERAVDILLIPTLEGVMTAKYGDWIIRGIQGELYPCKPDVFEQTYEMVTTD